MHSRPQVRGVADEADGHPWKFVPGTTVERKYTFTWDEGLYVDSLMLSRDEKTLKGKNQEGKPISATKIP